MDTGHLAQALGPLAALYADPQITEIMVDSPDRVYVVRNERLEDAGVVFEAAPLVGATVHALLALAGTKLGPGATVADARLPDGATLAAILPPTAVESACFTLRKWRADTITWADLIGWGTLTGAAQALLQRAVAERASVLVAGGVGSGKTTLLNVLTGSIGAEERTIAVEDTHEIQSRAARTLYLEAGGATALTLADLLGQAIKLRPERLLVSELRGAEAMRLVQIVNAGHDGALALIHADDARDALQRLETMCLMANLGLPLADIRQAIATAFRLVVSIQRQPGGRRRLTHITAMEAADPAAGPFDLVDLFVYDPTTDQLQPTPAAESWQP